MPANEILALVMFLAFIGLVFTGFPIAWILAGLAVLFTALAIVFEVDFGIPIGVDWAYASISVERIWNVMENWVMVALPMFVFMGLMLDRSGIANRLMTSFARLFGRVGGGMAVTITLIGVLLAATTGIIGASRGPARTAWPARHAPPGLRQVARGWHRLRGRHAGHPHTAEHHARSDGGSDGDAGGRPFPGRCFPPAWCCPRSTWPTCWATGS